MTRKAKVWGLYILLVCLNIFDYMATDLIIMAGGYEANPLQNMMIQEYGTIGIMYFKTPFLVMLAGFLMMWDKFQVEAQRSLEIGLFVCTVIYCFLAVWHCILMTLILYRAG